MERQERQARIDHVFCSCLEDLIQMTRMKPVLCDFVLLLKFELVRSESVSYYNVPVQNVDKRVGSVGSPDDRKCAGICDRDTQSCTKNVGHTNRR